MRADLIAQLEAYLPRAADRIESGHVLKTIDFVRRTPRAFERDHVALGHVTASALVVSAGEEQELLLNKHGVEGVYLNFGGHCDGDEDTLAVASRELVEETSIAVARCDGRIFDVDVNYIGSHRRRGVLVPDHLHYDVRYLFVVPRDVAFSISEESTDARWFPVHEVMATRSGLPDVDLQMRRMAAKVANRR